MQRYAACPDLYSEVFSPPIWLNGPNCQCIDPPGAKGTLQLPPIEAPLCRPD